MQTIERIISPSAAIQLALESITYLNLKPEIQSFGKNLSIYRCNLFNDNGIEVSVGNGKGLEEQSLASAFFEALEHYLTQARFVEQVEWRTMRSLAMLEHFEDESVTQILLKQIPDCIIPCRSYTELTTGKSVPYPLFLSIPDYITQPFSQDTSNSHRFGHYCTNSGTAIGVIECEAIIHSICELIERDALSCFLIQSFLTRMPPPLKIIDHESLPITSKSLVKLVEDQIGSHLVLIDMMNDFQIPSFLVVTYSHDHVIPFVGSEASLSSEYALERAVLEVLQEFRLSNEESEQRSVIVLKSFHRLEKYRQCLNLEFTHNPSIIVGFQPSEPTPNKLEDYLSHLLRRINNQGFRVYSTYNKSFPSGVVCVHCIIPGLERFHLVRSGMPVLPGARGMNILKR